jgi:RNA polymerase sigma-70 factor (ECF subfamily)
MVKTAKEFHALMQEVLSGSDSAAAELFRDYEPYLMAAIRRRLSRRIRSKFDSMDIAQDVWKSFFAGLPEENTFKSPDDLAAFLTRLARNKVVDVNRQRLDTQKHDVRREQSLDDSTCFDKGNIQDNAQRTPSQVVMSQEEWQKYLSKQPIVYRHILMRMCEGKRQAEIAEELDISVKLVQRVIDRAMARAES